jgi:hypothetical protein
VFDPLALVLILAADQTFAWAREDKRPGWKQQWIPTTEDPWHDEPAPKEKDWSTFFTKQEPVEIKEELNGVDAEKFIQQLNENLQNPKQEDIPVLEGEETQAQRLIDEAEAKNQTLARELEAVKATAENLKKKFVNWIKDPLKK